MLSEKGLYFILVLSTVLDTIEEIDLNVSSLEGAGSSGTTESDRQDSHQSQSTDVAQVFAEQGAEIQNQDQSCEKLQSGRP